MTRECETPLLWMGEDELREYARMLMRLLLTSPRKVVDLPSENACFEVVYCPHRVLSSAAVH